MLEVDELLTFYTVCQHALQDTTTLFDEKWDGTEEEELSCFVSEV